MKKTLLLSLILFAFAYANAQPRNEVSEFNKWSNTLDSGRREASKAKDYRQCIALINSWVSRYDQLKPAVQQNFKQWRSGMYYNLACYYALTGQKPQALESFRTAVAAGYKDYNDTLTDSDLNSLRDDPDFKAQLDVLRQNGDYLYLLKRSGPYDDQNNNLPAFAYQDASNARLSAFKVKYKLDSVAGDGDEISRFK